MPGFKPWLRYRYDEQRRLVALGYDGRPDLVRLEYHQADRQVIVIYANGVTQYLSLNARSQIKQIQVTSPEDELILDLPYRARTAGNITAVNDQRFRYDRRGQLIEYGPLLGDRICFRYDNAGNRLEVQAANKTTATYQYDPAGRLTSWRRPNGALVRCSYDGEGNLVARSDRQTQWSYHYDGAGRLIRAARNQHTVAEYGYDHAGWRVLKRTGTETVVTHRDPWGNLLAETMANGETRVYLGPAGQHLACLVIRAGQVTTLFLHPDHLGSIRAVSDAQGQLVARYDFDPFGNEPVSGRRSQIGNSQPVSRRASPTAGSDSPTWLRVFAGHRFDPDLKLYECGVRLYDPEVGRFISPDTYTFSADDPRLLWLPAPVETRRQLRQQRLKAWQRSGAQRNRYVYALNNPLTYVDRDGHQAGLYFLYTLLAIFWALPYTLVGFLFFEVWVNWITFAWLWDWGNHEWSGESSDRLGAWAWWTIGGLAGRIVIGGGAFTLGNFVIANADFLNGLDTTVRSFGIPARHNDLVAIPPANLLTERESVVEHELRHTNQYGWWGPFMMPWVLILFFLFQNLVLHGISLIAREDVHLRWGDIWNTLTDTWWKRLIDGIGLLILPGAYWWDMWVRGGYAESWFEQNAAHHSGSSDNINIRASASQDRVAPGGTAIISVIFNGNPISGVGASVTTPGSGAPTVVDITPTQITNLRVFRYTAGANQGTDEITATGGGQNFTLEIEVR